MKNQRRFATIGGQFTSESVARFTGISIMRYFNFKYLG
jgi:hypothetical protein